MYLLLVSPVIAWKSCSLQVNVRITSVHVDAVNLCHHVVYKVKCSYEAGGQTLDEQLA